MKTLFLRTAALLLFSTIIQFAYADGTKQVMPSTANGVAYQVTPSVGLGSYRGSSENTKIRFYISNFSTEKFYFGYKAYNRAATPAEVTTYYRIVTAAGTQMALGSVTSTSTSGRITSYTQATTGPVIGTMNAGGYTPQVFTPTANGEYYIEIYQSTDNGATVTSNQSTLFVYFDFTVATTTAQLPGRVYSRAWSYLTYIHGTTPTYVGDGTQSLAANFYGYTQDSTITKVTFNSGFRPFGFTLSLNETGPDSTASFENDRKSINSGGTAPALKGLFPVFMTVPDATVFPRSGVPAAPVINRVYGCSGTGYFVSYTTKAPGDIAILLDLDGNNGYTAGTADRYLYAYDVAAGKNVIRWDGKNGLGALVSSGSAKITLYLRRGRTNLPIYDAELNENDLTVSGTEPVVYAPKLFWDDASLVNIGTTCTATYTSTASSETATANNNLTGGGISNTIEGQSSPGHAWDGPGAGLAVPALTGNMGSTTAFICDDYGNARTVNTWFYTNEIPSTGNTFVLPPCDRDGDGIDNTTDIDDDNDGITDLVENGGVDALADADGDGIPNYLDADFCTLNAMGVCSSMDADGDGIINSFDLDSDNDGITDIVEAGGVDTNGDGRVDYASGTTWASNDTDGDGLLDRYDATETNPNVAGIAIRNLDSDGDGVPNFRDLDSDNDGIPDVVEAGGTDTNGDGRLDTFVDSDNDGLADLYDGDIGNDGMVEAGGIAALIVTGTYVSTSSPIPASYPQGIANDDGRDMPNFLDLDSDDDGIADVTEAGGTDANYDGRLDYSTTTFALSDTDGDGLLDSADGDVGNDGVAENTTKALLATGSDTNNDGRPDGYPYDNADGTFRPNPYDADSDDDGIPDLIESGGVDSNGGGRIDAPYTDGNSNGWLDAYDPTMGGINLRTLDANGSAAGGGVFDFDNDGIPNYIDLDSDNDGIADIIEQGGTDTNNDGKVDLPAGTTYADNDKDFDGFIDVYDPVNNALSGSVSSGKTPLITASGPVDATTKLPTIYSADDNMDKSGLINMLDLDADNDGLLDTRESGISSGSGTALDANNDGVVDAGWADSNGDGWADVVKALPAFVLRNTDGIGFANYLDIDSDDDGIPDNIETQLTPSYVPPAGTDADFDGIDDAYDNDDTKFGGSDNNGLSLVDTDGDGISDYRDLDSDNDGYPDFVEGHDTDGDHKANANTYTKTGFPGTADADNDGLLDGWDNNIAAPVVNNGTTTLNYPNAGAASTVQRLWRAVGNTDGKDLANATDIDDDNDGITDVLECGGFDPTADADGDGIPNYLDTTPGTGLPAFADANGDRINDAYDYDLDGILNSLDLDTDNDGIPDIVEAGGADIDGDGVVDTFADLNNNGLADIYDPNAATAGTALTSLDTDGDGIPNVRDLDSDNDGIPDLIEAGGTDTNKDGVIDAGYKDVDGDGFADAVDGDVGNDGTAENTLKVLIVTGAAGTNGRPASYPRTKTDGSLNGNADANGLPNPYDLDSDDDGIADIVEAGGVDTNGDGRVDYTSGTTWASNDTDGDGLINTYDVNSGNTGIANLDTDGDGYANYQDLDSDNDGIPDVLEAGGIDTNNDGKINEPGSTATPADTDGDGLADIVDGDVGNLGGANVNSTRALILTNAAATGSTTGAPTGYPRNKTAGGANGNTDGIGLPNPYDLDADGDGILDSRESGLLRDINNDGVVNAADNAAYTDANKDGWVDIVGATNGVALALVNTDNRGGANYLDIDADDDGITDNVEGQTTKAYKMPTGLDADSDGIDDAYDNNTAAFAGDANNGIVPVNTDNPNFLGTTGDLIPDYLDTDTDDDNMPDLQEGYGVPAFALPNTNDTDNDGLLDPFETFNMMTSTISLQYNVTMRYMNAGGEYIPTLLPTLYGTGNRIYQTSKATTADRDWRDKSIVLPVKLISFTAGYANKAAGITWTTANEDGHERYLLERSIDGSSFSVVTSATAKGTAASSYIYTDNAIPAANVVYYRLQMVNADGSISYSKVVALRLGADKLNLSIYPNPVVDQVSISFASTTAQAVTVKVYNLHGAAVMAQVYKAQAGTNTLQLNGWNQLPAGDYLVEVGNDTFKLMQKITHVH